MTASGRAKELERRLHERGTDSRAAIERRLEVARREMIYISRYRHEVINDKVDQAACQICEILTRYGDS